MNAGPLVFMVTLGIFEVLLVIAVTCLGLVGQVVWANRATAAEARLVAAPARCVVLGLVDVLGSVLLVMLTGAVMPVLSRLLALVLLLLLGVLLLIGLPALLAGLGERVLSLADRTGSRAQSTATGAVTLCGAGMLPWVGWAVLLVALLAAVGAAAMAALRK